MADLICPKCNTERVGTAIKVCQKCGFKFQDKTDKPDYSKIANEYERKEEIVGRAFF